MPSIITFLIVACLATPRIPSEELLVQLRRDSFQMHKVALATSGTLVEIILAAACFTEICNRRKLCHNGPSSIKPARQATQCLFCILFVAVLDVDIANQVRPNIIAHVEFFHFTEVPEFVIHVFKKLFEVLLILLLVLLERVVVIHVVRK